MSELSNSTTQNCMDCAILQSELSAALHKQQAFFEELQTAMGAPAYGHHAKALYGHLLLRATEAGLYTPKLP